MAVSVAASGGAALQSKKDVATTALASVRQIPIAPAVELAHPTMMTNAAIAQAETAAVDALDLLDDVEDAMIGTVAAATAMAILIVVRTTEEEMEVTSARLQSPLMTNVTGAPCSCSNWLHVSAPEN